MHAEAGSKTRTVATRGAVVPPLPVCVRVTRAGVATTVLADFAPYGSDFTGGVRVSLRDIDGDGRDDIVTGAGVGGGPAVRVTSGATGAELDSFYSTDPDNLGGVYVG